MPPITNPQAELTLGGLDLMGRDRTGPYWFQAFAVSANAGNMDLGNPEVVEREIESLLQDGTIVTVDSYGNREMPIPVSVYAEDSYGLAAGEMALMAEVRRRNVLTWTPANIITGAGDPCVFDVVHSEPTFAFDASVEVTMLRRTYTITVKALPHARSPIQRTASLQAPGGVTPTITLINDCTSLTGWARTPSYAALTTSGGQVKLDWSNPYGTDILGYLELHLGGLSTNMATSPYLRIDLTTDGTGRYSAQDTWVQINGVPVAPIATNGSVAWYPFSGTINDIVIGTSASVSRYGKLHIYAADISRSTLPQDASGSRQMFGSVEVAGSVRTEATIAVSDETPAALGSVLIYTAPNKGSVAQPPLRARQVVGPGTTDTTRISGKSSDLLSTHSFDTPASQIPDGTYLLMAYVKAPSTGNFLINWAALPLMGGTDLGGRAGSQTFALTSGVWTMVSIALISLPLVTMGPSGTVRVNLSGTSGLLLDEAWLFNMDTGVLSWVELGTGTPAAGGSSSMLWLDPATLEQPSASVTAGTLADRSDSYTPMIDKFFSWGPHEMVPPSMNIFIAASNSIAFRLLATYYPRFFTHVFEDA